MLQTSIIGGEFRTYAIEDGMVFGFVRAATIMLLEVTAATRRPAHELQPPLTGGIPRHSSPTPSHAASTAALHHPHAACTAAPRRPMLPVPQPRAIPTPPT
jgi:hypothetical protein